MNTWVGILVLVIGIASFGTWSDEIAKYNTAFYKCEERWTKNERIKGNDICSDPHERILHGEKAQHMCIRAEQENYLTPRQCARQLWWDKCLIRQVAVELAGSYWKVMPVFVILSIAGMYFVYSLFKEKAKVREFFHMFHSMKQEYTPALPAPTRHTRYPWEKKVRFADCETVNEIGYYD